MLRVSALSTAWNGDPRTTGANSLAARHPRREFDYGGEIG
jgi:hypothetical protein